MEISFNITLLIVMTVTCGISAQVLAAYLKVPAIVFLLLFGILAGPDCLGILHPSLLGNGLEVMVSLCVALILFEGGLNLELRDLGKVSGSIRNLVTFGTLITLIGGGMAAHWLGEFPWPIAFLYASLVVVTGPTVIGPLLKQVSVDKKVAALLEGEGVLVDPVGAILAVLVLNVVLNGNTDLLILFRDLMVRLGVGTVIGVTGGWLLGLILKRAKFLSEDLKNLVVLAGLWGLFAISEQITSESGLMATVLSGIVIRAASVPEERLLRRFKGQLTVLSISVLFVLLAADLSLESVVALGWGSVFTVLALMWIVRPINIWLCTINSGLNWRQKLFACWVAPRGIISASIASLFAILLTQRGVTGGDSIKALVFLTIIITVFLQGLTAGPIAKILDITLKSATGAVIVGSNPLSRLIARLFQERGESVAIIDTDPEACEQAEKAGLRVFLSSALDHSILEEAGLDSMGTFLAMTNNGEVNLVLAQRAAEEFAPPRVLAMFPKDPQANMPANQNKINQAFVSDLPLKDWNEYLNNSEVKLGETELRSEGLKFQIAHLEALVQGGELAPLLVERQGYLQVVSAAQIWEAGDRIIYLLHDPTPKLLKRLSGGSQSRLTLEKHQVVEEVPIPDPVLEPVLKEAEIVKEAEILPPPPVSR
ncbi:cation:proton antiporter [Tychonema sp. LEGE 07199]|uniref:cation:proton antiporter n=1 Tax=unclassified Tychonema TaxID=2642144 RepID=UPI001881D047|nr:MULTISPECIES: cation:proton antiporter [unclassified Tychonema]MBE9121134.1 cation:proton antiporter [Tychonema sp. LEGE 07199]MBE9132282.1 cation:proton antiporter [Tychonema sp. LEGE 07196]